jgi:hypothetical protein
MIRIEMEKLEYRPRNRSYATTKRGYLPGLTKRMKAAKAPANGLWPTFE